jgi:hypothetical protein
MRRRLGLLAVWLGLGLAAGGGDDSPDITGHYQITSIEESATACSGGAPPDPAPTHFRVTQDELLGVPVFTLDTCSSAALDSCDPSGHGLVAEPTDDGYRGAFDSYAGSPEAGCTLLHGENVAALDGEVLTWTDTRYAEDGVTGADCTTDEAADRGTDMPCVAYYEVVGARVE